jgi:hypothetical protein
VRIISTGVFLSPGVSLLASRPSAKISRVGNTSKCSVWSIGQAFPPVKHFPAVGATIHLHGAASHAKATPRAAGSPQRSRRTIRSSLFCVLGSLCGEVLICDLPAYLNGYRVYLFSAHWVILQPVWSTGGMISSPGKTLRGSSFLNRSFASKSPVMPQTPSIMAW